MAKCQRQLCIKKPATFYCRSQLESSYKNFHRIKNRVIDSVIQYGIPYLYSWQENGSALITFTTLVDDGEHGSRIVYFIFNEKDSLLSATHLAQRAGEGGIIYESRSTFIAKDTVYKTIAASTEWDLTQREPWCHPFGRYKGDSTFFHLVISKDGRVIEKKLAEKNELNLDD